MKLKPLHYALIGIGAAVLVFLLMLAGSYNSFVTRDLDVQSQFSELQNQYQRQADLIPNLVSVVSSSASFESGLLNNLTALRSRWSETQNKPPAAVDQAGLSLTSGLSRLIAVFENYPDLKTSAQYTGLRDELSGTQNRISTARGRWISAIKDYNRAVQTFPGFVFAGWFGFAPKEFYETAPETFTTPKIGTGQLP